MATGSVYAAKVNLKALLEAWPWAGTPPSIAYGGPTEQEDMTLDAVYFGGMPRFNTVFRLLGATRSDEEFTLPVIVDVRRYGDDEQSTEQRAIELYYEVLTLLQKNMTLNGAVNRITGYAVAPATGFAPQSWRSTVQIDVQCVGFITY
jgi:hypothetical protein